MAKDYYKLFEVDTSVDNLKTLREEIKLLKKEMENLAIGSEEYEKVSDQVWAKQTRLNEIMKEAKRPLQDAEGSFNSLNAKLRTLKEEWKATGDEMRRGALTEEINEVKGRMNAMNESIGNYQHNVGNYTNSIIEAFNKMGISFGGNTTKMIGMFNMMGGSLSNLGNSFKSLWATMTANPIGVVIVSLGALVGALAAVRKAIHANEEAEERWHRAMAAFRPIADGYKNWIDQVAQGFVTFTENIADAYRWLERMIARYNDWRGMTEGEEERVKARQTLRNALADAENKMDDRRREARRFNAEDEAAIEDLKEAAIETDKMTEKVEALTKAKEIQMKVNKRNIDIAEAELKILQTQASLGPNSAADNDALAEAEAKVKEARRNGVKALKAIEKQLKSYTKSVGTATQKVNEHAKALEEALKLAQTEITQIMSVTNNYQDQYMDGLSKALDLLNEEQKANLSELELEEMAYQEKLKLFEKYGLSTEELETNHLVRMEELRKEALEREREMFEKAHKDEEEDDKKAKDKYEALMKARQTATKNMVASTSSLLKNLATAMGENTKLGKGFSIAAATIDTIASAVAGFRAGMNQWADAGPMAWMAPVQAALNATMALTAGYAEVQKIRSVDTSGNVSSGGGGMATALAMPNIAGLSTPMEYTRQVVTDTEQEQMNQNNRVYILEEDIQQSNNRVKVREEETTF